jgi:hypothetical protein
MIENLLERLAELFPRQNYQSRLEQYIATKGVKSAADVEYWTREYEKNHAGNLR